MKIPKGSYDHPEIAPAWLPIVDGEGRAAKPLIRCKCQRLMGIRLHQVHADGRVTASFYHPETPGVAGSSAIEPGCGFHEFLELDGYDGPEFPPVPVR